MLTDVISTLIYKLFLETFYGKMIKEREGTHTVVGKDATVDKQTK